MDLPEDQIFESCGTQYMHCTWNTLLPYEYEWTCFSCVNNFIKRRNELTKTQLTYWQLSDDND